jgi:hypothetical protein
MERLPMLGGVCKAMAVVALGPASCAWAAHPLQTEDTGTQGAGRVELEGGLTLARAGGERGLGFQPQISFGVAPTLDLILKPSWERQRDASGVSTAGWGDTDLDLKWRALSAEPVSLGLRTGLTLPTSQHGLGQAQGRVGVHATLVASWLAAPFAAHANLGLTQSPSQAGQRSRVARASGALVWAATEQLNFTFDLGTQQPTEAGLQRWSASALVGLIYTLQPGLDLDLGYQETHRTPVKAKEWLAGLTYRFAR